MNTSQLQYQQRRSALCLSMAFMFLVLATTVLSQPAIVSFEPAQITIECGETGTIAVHIDASIDDLRGFSLVLVFDPDLISPASIEVGSLIAGAGCPHTLFWVNPNGSGSIEVDGAMLGCSIAGPGAILSIEFQAVEDNEGESALACQSIILRDGENATIPVDCQQGTIRVTCAINTFQGSWGMVKALYR